MRKKTTLVSAMVCVVAAVNFVPACLCFATPYSGSGAGNSTSPYLITTYAELCEIKTCTGGLSAYWKLSNDIDAGASNDGDHGWMPIGAGVGGGVLTGSFDGDGKTISHLFINRPVNNDGNTVGGAIGCGFFSMSSGVIKNLGLTDVNITGEQEVGAICGWQFPGGIITNCYCSGTVKGLIYVSGGAKIGGLCGYNDAGNISDSHSSVTVITENSHENGGFCGNNPPGGNISRCYATGDVSGWLCIGGFVGINEGGVIRDCYSRGNVSGVSVIGGFCGANDYMDYQFVAQIYNCYSTGLVTPNDHYWGGAGFCGKIPNPNNPPGFYSNCFYDSNTSGYTDDANRGTPKTTAQMKQINTFTNWDFVETWGIEDNQTYPFLKLTYPTGDLNYDKVVNFLDFAILAEDWLER